MFNFNDALAVLLELYGDIVRNSGEVEHRDVQRFLARVAKIIREEDAEALASELEDIREWYSERVL